MRVAFKYFTITQHKNAKCHIAHLQQASPITTTLHSIWIALQFVAGKFQLHHPTRYKTLTQLQNESRKQVRIPSKLFTTMHRIHNMLFIRIHTSIPDRITTTYSCNSRSPLLAIKNPRNWTAQPNVVLIIDVWSEHQDPHGRNAHTKRWKLELQVPFKTQCDRGVIALLGVLVAHG